MNEILASIRLESPNMARELLKGMEKQESDNEK